MDQDKVQRIVEKWRQEYDKAVPGHLLHLQELIDAMKREMNEENLKAFRLVIHKMAGSAGTVGYMRVSEICKKYDEELFRRMEAFNEISDKSKWIGEYQGYLEEIKTAFKM